MKPRLAKMEVDRGFGISVKRSLDFGECTLHGHDFYELDIIIRGSQSTILNGKPRAAFGGCVFFLSPEDFHEYLGDGRVDILNLQFLGDLVSSDILRRMVDRKSRVYTPNECDITVLSGLFSALEEMLTRGESAIPISIRLVESMLLILLGKAKNDADIPVAPVSDIQRALVYIHEHFKENPSLAEVAEILPLDPRYFCTKFKEYTGKSYKEYLRERKLRYARRLILATSLPLIAIASESGYATQSHFNREFRAYYGVSPTELRKNSTSKA